VPGLRLLAVVAGQAEVVASAEDVAVVGGEEGQEDVQEEDMVAEAEAEAEAEGGEDMIGQSICLQITP